MGMGDLSNLFVDPDEDQPVLADHSVLNAQDTFEIPDRNGSHNVKGEAAEQWGANRSYGGFPAVENTGGLHEFMPDPEKSQFVPEEDLPRVASQLIIRAKRAMMKGASPEAVLEDLRRRIPKEARFRKYFTRLAGEISNEVGLLGTVYIDPSIFASCSEGVKFLNASSLNPTYVLELQDCKKCAYRAEKNCVLFQCRIEAHIPWEDKVAVHHMVKKAAAEVGATDRDIEALSSVGQPEEVVRALYLRSFKEDRLRVYEGDESEALQSDSSPSKGSHNLFAAAVLALEAEVPILKIVDRLNSKTGSIHETRRIMKQALTDIGVVKQAQFPCPDCQVKVSSNRGKLLASVLPYRLAVSPGEPCRECGRQHGKSLNMWGKPMVTAGMALGFGRGRGNPMKQGIPGVPDGTGPRGGTPFCPVTNPGRGQDAQSSEEVFAALLDRRDEEQIPVDMVESLDPDGDSLVDMSDLTVDIEMTMDEG